MCASLIFLDSNNLIICGHGYAVYAGTPVMEYYDFYIMYIHITVFCTICENLSLDELLCFLFIWRNIEIELI